MLRSGQARSFSCRGRLGRYFSFGIGLGTTGRGGMLAMMPSRGGWPCRSWSGLDLGGRGGDGGRPGHGRGPTDADRAARWDALQTADALEFLFAGAEDE